MRISELTTRSAKLNTGTAYFAVDQSSDTVTNKIDYAELAKQIITEYNAQTLAGAAQSVKAALDALNSKSFIDSQEINGDIDDQSTYPTGTFLIHFAIAKTEASGTKPLTDGFLVTFIYRNNPSTPTSSYMTQVFIEDNLPIVYIRGFNKGTWSNWKLLQSS